MAVEAFVGLVGGGKSYNSVRRMMSYMAIGGRCCSNILLKGYDASARRFDDSSPVLSFLRSIGWEYQPGQYTYISFDEMVSNPNWISAVPAGVDRYHRTLLVVDEATDLFDSLDGGRLRVDSQYREIFHFLRLSRHVHVDVLFVVQDLASINTRLRGLVSYIWRSTDMKKFRMAKLKIPFPFDLFMLQQFDRSGKYEVRRDWVKKDPRVFTLYESEAFNNALAVKWDGVAVDVSKGRKVKEAKKMNKFQMFLLLFSVGLGLFNLFRSRSSAGSSPSACVTNYVVSVVSNCVVSSDGTNSASSSFVRFDKVLVKRGSFRYIPKSATDNECVVFDNSRLYSGQPCEYGYIKTVGRDMVTGEGFEGGLFYLLPEYQPISPEGGTVRIERVGKQPPPRGGPF